MTSPSTIILRVGDIIPLPSNEKIRLKYGSITKIDDDKITVKTLNGDFYLDKTNLQKWVTGFLHRRGLILQFLESRVVPKSNPRYSDNYYQMRSALKDAFIQNKLKNAIRDAVTQNEKDEYDKLVYMNIVAESHPNRLMFKNRLIDKFRLKPEEADLLSRKSFWDKFTNNIVLNQALERERHALYMSDPRSQRKLLRKKKSSKSKIKRKCRCK